MPESFGWRITIIKRKEGVDDRGGLWEGLRFGMLGKRGDGQDQEKRLNPNSEDFNEKCVDQMPIARFYVPNHTSQYGAYITYVWYLCCVDSNTAPCGGVRVYHTLRTMECRTPNRPVHPVPFYTSLVLVRYLVLYPHLVCHLVLY